MYEAILKSLTPKQRAKLRAAARRELERRRKLYWDNSHRVTMSARLLVDEAERVRLCALLQGKSVYRLIYDLLLAELDRTGV